MASSAEKEKKDEINYINNFFFHIQYLDKSIGTLVFVNCAKIYIINIYEIYIIGGLVSCEYMCKILFF